MYSVTRNRETIYGNYILHYHPDYAGKVPFYYTPDEPYTLEGGDILNLSADTIAVGISQRTMPEAVERLAYNIFQDEAGEVRRVLALDIPSTRAFMHLDTVLTQIDTDKFLIHPSILDELEMFELTPAAAARRCAAAGHAARGGTGLCTRRRARHAAALRRRRPDRSPA